MPRCAVVGSPIAFSRSPVLHRAAYAALDLTGWTYERVQLARGELSAWISDLDDRWVGLSVTMPLKQEAIACAHSVSELAMRIGSANTMVATESGWHADNTDVDGLLGALAEVQPEGRRSAGSVTIVGAGGTGAAAVAAVAALGYPHVGLVVRDRARASGLMALIQGFGMTGQVHPWPTGEGYDLIARSPLDAPDPLAADLVISTVPAAATADLLEHSWRPGQTVLDVTYDPWPTALVQAAIAGGSTAIDGTSVLLWQAARQVELMTHQPAPVDAMRTALLPDGNLAPE